MIRWKHAVLAGVVAVGVCAAPMSQADSGPRFFELLTTAENDPDMAVEQLDALIEAELAAEPRNTRLLFDLFELRAELAVQLGDPARASELTAELAQMAAKSAELDEDPVPLWHRAAGLAEATGDLRQARRLIQAKVLEQITRNFSGAAVAATYDDLARLSELLGDAVSAASAQEAAKAARMPVEPQDSATRGGDEIGYRKVAVYYATDRARTGDTDPSDFYGAGRSDRLEMGVAEVTIPNSHAPGMLEGPSIWKLQFAPNPTKHVVLQSVTPIPAHGFYSRLQGEFSSGEKSEAFVFIHGFNVAFDQAARRAAQIAYDLDYPGVPILYSWPSRGKTVAYVADTAVVRLSGRRLAGFLDDLVEKSGATTIHIVAHSMGNRALTDALELLALKRGIDTGDTPLFGQVLFAAPDVDAGLFAAMIETIRPIAQRLTLYASERDWALVSSRKLHGNAPRAGQGGVDTLISGNIDSIDMSELGEDMLAHSYVADDSSALADMSILFWRNADPARRCGLEAVTGPNALVKWRYKRGTCTNRNLIDALAHLRKANVTSVEDALSLLADKSEEENVTEDLAPVITRILEQ